MANKWHRPALYDKGIKKQADIWYKWNLYPTAAAYFHVHGSINTVCACAEIKIDSYALINNVLVFSCLSYLLTYTTKPERP